ncbi:pentatricopeptide repeat-containing protein At3g02650, mitochondrial [Trifolium pratense]|uniref:pentatricopeptide repeat-containing protein At3g02650, mitochondrial n=1 Tax=Trifolium pratense TaxID=57577 RepID=UPI001E691409|nr:pentatricopeptide repeat-containing protein At3g02650, mitochondrial [Trifolium pratense]
MWRSILARQRCAVLRNYNANYGSQIQVPLSNLILNPTNSTTSNSLGFPQISYLSNTINNPRFLSNQIATENDVPIDSKTDLENGDFAVHGIRVENDDVDEFGNGIELVEKVGEIDEEQQVYQIDEEKLEKVVSLLQSSADGSFESSLDQLNLSLNQDFVIKAIETIETVFVENLVRFFKWAWKENSLEVTTQVVEPFVMICNSGGSLTDKDVYSLWDLVKEIGEKEDGVVNVTILNELIRSFSKLGKGKAALEAFEKFELFRCVPDADTYYYTIGVLSRRSDFDLACSVCQKMLDAQIIPGGEKIGGILSCLCKGEKAKEAHAVYTAAIENKKYPPLSSVNFLVKNLSHKNETVQLALEVLNDIPTERRRRAIKPFTAVVRALCRIKDVDSAKELVLKMIADGPPPGNAVFNFVITGYSQVGEMGKAVEMLRLLESRGLKPDVYTYSVIASAYSNRGEMEEARKILEEAKKNHLKLSPVMYHAIIRGYCKLEQFDEALELLPEMKDFGERASAHEYEKLIQSLCLKALDWERAEKLQEEMKEKGLHLKGITRALVRAVKEAEKEAVEAQNDTLVS